MPPLHLFIKPASGNCNLYCSYCFYKDITKHRKQESYGIMAKDTMLAIIQKAFDYAETECTFSFQGGEPTLAGLGFYRSFLSLCEKYNKNQIKLHFAIQTNGFSITEEWAAFLAEHHFLTGISLDGTIHTHNLYRRTPDNHTTFIEVMRTIGLLRKYNADFNILTVINKKTASAIDKIYAFYKKNHFEYLQFIPCLDPLKSMPGSMEYSLSAQTYATFLCRLFDLWYTDFKNGQGISIRQFDNYLSLLLYGYAEACDMNGSCSMQHVVEADGSVYPCDFFVLDQYFLGNLIDTDLQVINQKRKELKFIEHSAEKPKECLSCQYFSLCRNGCMRYRINNKNIFCEAYQQFFTYSLPRFMELAELVSKVL